MQVSVKRVMVLCSMLCAFGWGPVTTHAAPAPQKDEPRPSKQTVTIVGKVFLADGKPAKILSAEFFDLGSRRGSLEFIGNARSIDEGEFRFLTERAGNLMVRVQTAQGGVTVRFEVRPSESKILKIVLPRS